MTPKATIHRFSRLGALLAMGVAGAWSIAGCGTIGVSFTPTRAAAPHRPPRPADQVELVLDPETPRCTFHIVGLYESGQDGGVSGVSMSEAREKLREDAGRRGFDGLMSLACADPGTVGATSGRCTAKAYVCE
jgi:hypothetical protein